MSQPTIREVQAMSPLTPSAVTAARYDNVVDTDVLEVALDDQTRDALAESLSRGISSPYDEPERAIPEAVRAFQRAVSPAFLATLERFVIDPGSKSGMHVTNLPIDADLPSTPPDGQSVDAKTSYVSEGVMLGIGRILGHPYAFKEEKKGKIVQQICPVMKSEQKLSNEGSRVDLSMHVENSFSEFRPNYLMLLCLRGDRDHKAMTRIAAGQAIASRLSPEHLAIARLPEFRIQCPDSFSTKPGEAAYSDPTPIFMGPDRYLELRLDLPEYTECLTDRASEAYAAILEALAEPGVVHDVDLQPGDALILANRKIAHGRTVFTPRYDGKDRWLQRMFTISDPWAMRGNVDERLRLV